MTTSSNHGQNYTLRRDAIQEPHTQISRRCEFANTSNVRNDVAIGVYFLRQLRGCGERALERRVFIGTQ